MAFVQKEALHVTRDPVGEFARLLVCVVERKYFHGVNSSDSAAHCLGGIAEHIYIRIVNRLVPSACDCVNLDLAAVFLLCSVSLHDVGPEKSGCTELGNLHEVVAADGNRELDSLCRLVNLYSGILQEVEVFAAHIHSVCKLLCDGADCIVERV